MLDPSRIGEPDFPLKIGMALILMDFRVQQSPKTRLYSLNSDDAETRKYLRVSELLIIDTMTYLRSETPIHIQPPVNQSQLQYRESIPSENTSPPVETLDTREVQTASTALQVREPIPQPITPGFPSQLLQARDLIVSQNVETSAANDFSHPSSSHYHQPTLPAQHHSDSSVNRVTSSFGYRPDTPENIVPLSRISSIGPGSTVGIVFRNFINADCLGIIQSVFDVRTAGRSGKLKRDLHLIDPTTPRHIILSSSPHLQFG